MPRHDTKQCLPHSFRQMVDRGRRARTVPAMTLAQTLAAHGIDLLATPTGPVFGDVVAHLNGDRFGALGALTDPVAHWDGVPEGAAAELHALAAAAGRELAVRHPGTYNGALPRLAGWSVDSDVLHLELAETSFLTWKVTTGNPELPARLRDATRVGLPGGASGAHHVPVTLGVVTRDGYIVLMQRGASMAIYPDIYTSAASGNIDLAAHGGHGCDAVAGTVDVRGAMLREAREELGSGIALTRRDMRAAALIRYTDARETDAPVLVFIATTTDTLDDLLFGLRYAHPTEGASELGKHVLAVPATPADPAAVAGFLLSEHVRGALTAPGLASTLLCLEPALRDAGFPEPTAGDRPAEVRRIPVVLPAGLSVGPGY